MEEPRTISYIFAGTWPQLLAAITGTLSAISDGMQYGWSAPVIPILQSNSSAIQITKTDEKWLETLYLIAGLAGLPITIYLVDKIGRHKSIIAANCVNLIAWILIALATTVEQLYVARFLTGAAADVAFVATPMYIAEIADQKVRGFLSGLIYLMMLIGVLLIYSIAPYVPFYVPSIVGGSLLIFQLATFSFMPESPYYLLAKGKYDKARMALDRLRTTKDNTRELEEIAIAIERQNKERGRPQDLIIVNNNRKAFIVVSVLTAAQHFCGFSVILMNMHLILTEAGSIYLESNLSAIIFSIIMLIAATFSSFFVDKYGRKFLLISSSILTGISLIVLAVYFHLKMLNYDIESFSWIPIACVMSYGAVFKFGLGMVPIVMVSELFSTKVKAMAMTFNDGLYVIFGFISIEFYQQISIKFGLHIPFYIFGVVAFLTAVFATFVVPETRGKTLEEIQSLLKGYNEP